MGFLSNASCLCGHLCAEPGCSEKIRESVLSNKGAIVSINSTGSGILIHGALVLTTHGTLPSITAAEDSDILVTRMSNAADSQDYRRSLAPERFFITNSVLDLTVVACDPTEVEVVQPLCLQNSVAPLLDFGRAVYLLGRQLTEEQGEDLMVGDGRITVGTDTLIKFSTDGAVWSPGSAGFDIHGNLAFMVCDPMKLVSAPQRKRISATAFWKKDFPKQFGIPVPVIRHWLNQNWRGSIEELDRPRIPSRLKFRHKERSTESSSSSLKLKRVHKENEQSVESSNNSESLKGFQKQMEEDEEVSSTAVGPEHELLYGSDIVSVDVGETQLKKNNNLRMHPPVLPENLKFVRSGIPEGEWEISGSRKHEGEGQIKKEYLECSTSALRMEDYVGKANNVGADQSGPGNDDGCLKENATVNTQEEKDAKEPIKAVLLKGTQNLHTPKKVHKESIHAHQNEIHNVSHTGSEMKLPKEKLQQFNSAIPKVVCKETSSSHPTVIHKKSQQHMEISFPKVTHEEIIPTGSTEVQKEKYQLLDIRFPLKHDKGKEKKISLSQLKEHMSNIYAELDNTEGNKQVEDYISSVPDGQSAAQYEFKEAGVSNEHERRGEGSLIFSALKDPLSGIHMLSDLDEKKHMKQNPSDMEEVWWRPTTDYAESSQHEANRGKLISCAQLKKPVPIVCIKAKHTEERRHGEEKLPTLQQALKRHNAECAESSFPDKHERCSEKSWNFANVKKPISSAIHLDLKHMEEEKQAKGDLPRKVDALEADDAEKAKEDQVAELKTEEDSSDNGSVEDFGIQMSHISSLIHLSTQKETDSSDIETMYSAETRESRNYSLRESYGKKNIPAVRRSQSSMTSIRGIQQWECDRRKSFPGRVKSAQPSHKNQVHLSCSKKISMQISSYRGPEYFGPTVSSIMKKRNLRAMDNKEAVPQQSPRWIF